MKKTFVASIQPEPDGPIFGRVDDPVQLQNAQDYAHDHIIRVTKDLLVKGAAAPQVAGFAATLTGNLDLSIAAGNAIDPNGIHYQLDSAAALTLDAADVANPRIDLIYATLAEDAQALSENVLFRQLRTQEELEAGADPYVPTQYNQPTELHSTATIAVRKGTPAGAPVAPAAGAGEVALWQVHVAAGQTVLSGGDLTDVRPMLISLYETVADVAGKVNKAGDTMTGGLNVIALLKIVYDVLFTDTTANIPKVAAAADPNKQLGFGFDNTNDVAFIQARRVGTGVKKFLINALGGLVGIGSSAVPSGANKSLAVGGGASIGSDVEVSDVPVDGLLCAGKATFGGGTNHSTLQSAGTVAAPYRATATGVGRGGANDLGESDFILELLSANTTAYLPDASLCGGRILGVKCGNATGQTVTPYGSQTIEGASGVYALGVLGRVRVFQSDGVSDWRIIGGFS